MPNIDSPDRSSDPQRTPPPQETTDELQEKPAREGLPPSYRMRAESHYVDLLSSRSAPHRERTLPPRSIEAPGLSDISASRPLVDSVRRNGVLEPLLVQSRGGRYRLISGYRRLAAALEAGVPTVPCLLHDVDDDEASRIAEAVDIDTTRIEGAAAADRRNPAFLAGPDVSNSLATLESCAGLLSGPGSELARAVVGNLLGAEIWRASTLVQATRVVGREVAVARTIIDIERIVSQLLERFLPERRLRSLQMESTVMVPPEVVVAGDERLLVGAMSSAVLVTIGLVDGVPGARIAVTATAPRSKQVALTVTQQTVAVPESWFVRAYDESWTGRPGGTGALLALLAVRETAALHGGHVALSNADPGTTITITLPTGPGRSS